MDNKKIIFYLNYDYYNYNYNPPEFIYNKN